MNKPEEGGKIMDKKRRFLFFILLNFLMHFSTAYADKIVISGDKWCPFNCEPNTAKPGYMVEVAQKIFSKAGHTVEYKVNPWERALQECREGKLNAVIGAINDEAPDFIFPTNELAINVDSLFVLKEKNWTYSDISSFSKVSIGAIKGYAYGSDELNEYIKKNEKNDKAVQLAFGDTALETNIKKLDAGRIDVVVESPAVFFYTSNQMKMNDRFKLAGKISNEKKVFIAFSPANTKSKEYAQLLSDGIDALRKSGDLKTILQKYGVDDWK